MAKSKSSQLANTRKILLLGSNRDSEERDLANSKLYNYPIAFSKPDSSIDLVEDKSSDKEGTFLLRFLCPPIYPIFAEELANMPLNRSLITDAYTPGKQFGHIWENPDLDGTLEGEESLDDILNRQKKFKARQEKLATSNNVSPFKNLSKSFLVWYQIHRLALDPQYKNKRIEFKFYDEEYSKEVYNFFQRRPWLLPARITLKCFKYDSTRQLQDDKQGSIKGIGNEIDPTKDLEAQKRKLRKLHNKFLQLATHPNDKEAQEAYEKDITYQSKNILDDTIISACCVDFDHCLIGDNVRNAIFKAIKKTLKGMKIIHGGESYELVPGPTDESELTSIRFNPKLDKELIKKYLNENNQKEKIISAVKESLREAHPELIKSICADDAPATYSYHEAEANDKFDQQKYSESMDDLISKYELSEKEHLERMQEYAHKKNIALSNKSKLFIASGIVLGTAATITGIILTATNTFTPLTPKTLYIIYGIAIAAISATSTIIANKGKLSRISKLSIFNNNARDETSVPNENDVLNHTVDTEAKPYNEIGSQA